MVLGSVDSVHVWLLKILGEVALGGIEIKGVKAGSFERCGWSEWIA